MSFSAFFPLGPARFQERFGLDFEDFAAGQVFRHRPGVTLSQQDNTDEALDTMNGAMLHYDARYAARTAYGKPLMVSTITLQRAIGMGSKTFGRRRAILEFPEIALTRPVAGGDTLYAESTILAAEPGDDDETGKLTVRVAVSNGEDVEVARITYVGEIWRRGMGPDAGGVASAAPRFAAWRAEGENIYTEQVGLFFEDFVAGESFVHAPRRSFYWDEAVEHSFRSLELNPQFHDLRWIAEHAAGKLRIPETFVVTAAAALSTRTFGRVVANLGWYDTRMLNKVYAGDTVEVESTVLEKRESKSRPNEGILSVETRARNQHGAPVLAYRRNLLVYRRAGETPYAAAGY